LQISKLFNTGSHYIDHLKYLVYVATTWCVTTINPMYCRYRLYSSWFVYNGRLPQYLVYLYIKFSEDHFKNRPKYLKVNLVTEYRR